MAYSKRHIVHSILALIIGAISFDFKTMAQEETSSKDRFFYLMTSFENKDLGDLYCDINGLKIKVTTSTAVPSKGYPIPAGGLIKIFREVLPTGQAITNPDSASQATPTDANTATAKPVVQVMAEIHLINVKPPVLIVLGHNPSITTASPLPLIYHYVSIRRGKDPANSAHFFNASSYKIAIRLGSNEFILDPGQDKMAPYIVKERGDVVSIKMASSIDAVSWKGLEDTGVMVNLGVRQMVIICDQEDSNGKNLGARYTMTVDYSKPPSDKPSP